ncbi:MAG: hypothetical protein AAFO15_02245, partial [Pseudomonadota bacterium]
TSPVVSQLPFALEKINHKEMPVSIYKFIQSSLTNKQLEIHNNFFKHFKCVYNADLLERFSNRNDLLKLFFNDKKAMKVFERPVYCMPNTGPDKRFANYNMYSLINTAMHILCQISNGNKIDLIYGLNRIKNNMSYFGLMSSEHIIKYAVDFCANNINKFNSEEVRLAVTMFIWGLSKEKLKIDGDFYNFTVPQFYLFDTKCSKKYKDNNFKTCKIDLKFTLHTQQIYRIILIMEIIINCLKSYGYVKFGTFNDLNQLTKTILKHVTQKKEISVKDNNIKPDLSIVKHFYEDLNRFVKAVKEHSYPDEISDFIDYAVDEKKDIVEGLTSKMHMNSSRIFLAAHREFANRRLKEGNLTIFNQEKFKQVMEFMFGEGFKCRLKTYKTFLLTLGKNSIFSNSIEGFLAMFKRLFGLFAQEDKGESKFEFFNKIIAKFLPSFDSSATRSVISDSISIIKEMLLKYAEQNTLIFLIRDEINHMLFGFHKVFENAFSNIKNVMKSKELEVIINPFIDSLQGLLEFSLSMGGFNSQQMFNRDNFELMMREEMLNRYDANMQDDGSLLQWCKLDKMFVNYIKNPECKLTFKENFLHALEVGGDFEFKKEFRGLVCKYFDLVNKHILKENLFMIQLVTAAVTNRISDKVNWNSNNEIEFSSGINLLDDLMGKCLINFGDCGLQIPNVLDLIQGAIKCELPKIKKTKSNAPTEELNFKQIQEKFIFKLHNDEQIADFEMDKDLDALWGNTDNYDEWNKFFV